MATMQTTGSQTTKTELPPWVLEAYKQSLATAQGAPSTLADWDPGFKAPLNPYLDQAMQNSANYRAPTYLTVTNNMMDQAVQAGMQSRNPYDVNYSNIYDPTKQQGEKFQGQNVQFEDTLAGYQPNMQGARLGGPPAGGFQAQDYNFKADQVGAERLGPAERVQADRIGPIGNVQAQQIGPMGQLGYERVGAGQVYNPAQNLNTFDIGAMQGINAPGLERYQMQGPADVTARDVTAGKWIDEGTRQAYMDPYMQAVVAEQQKDAQRTFDEQRAQSGGQAAAAGAFGGTRQAVLESGMRRDLANQKSGIAASGLQQAYQSGQQQYERDRGASMTAQQANQQAGLNAALANQQMGFNVGNTNLQANINQGQFGAQQGMQAQQFNQSNEMQRLLANQQAQLQTQGLGVNAGLQASLANQQYGMQAALANQQAGLSSGQFNIQQEMARQQANQQYGMQGQLANQQTELQRLMANQQYGLQGQMANQGATLETGKANQAAALQASLANQEANLQAQIEGGRMGQSDRQFGAGLTSQENIAQGGWQQEANALNANLGFQGMQTRYQGGLQAGLANQQNYMDAMRMQEQSRQWAGDLGQRQTEFGSDLNLRTQQAREATMSDIVRNNLAGSAQSADIWGRIGAFEGESFNQGLAANQQMGNFGMFQQGQEQDALNAQYAHWMQQQNYPMQYALNLGQVTNPIAQATGSTTTTSMAPKVPWYSQLASGLISGAGMLSNFAAPGSGGLFNFAKKAVPGAGLYGGGG